VVPAPAVAIDPMIIPTTLASTSSTGEIEVWNYHDDPKYISMWQDSDLIIIYADQVDALIVELKKFKENA
jgi:hypothetical protein